MKKFFSFLLLCSSIIISNAQAVAAPALFHLLAKGGAQTIAATAAIGPSIMSLTLVGTVAAIGQADETREKSEESNKDLTLTHIAHGWIKVGNKVLRGYNVAETAFMEAWNETTNTAKSHFSPTQKTPTTHPETVNNLTAPQTPPIQPLATLSSEQNNRKNIESDAEVVKMMNQQVRS